MTLDAETAGDLPLISVVIPTYQREGTILRALESVLAQSLAPGEIIVVDDGSTDKTPDLIRQYPSVRLVRQKQSGSAAARNRGVQEASAAWIAFLDSDDEWERDHLSRIAAAIARTSGQADMYFDDTLAAIHMLGEDSTSLYVGSFWEMAGFSPGAGAVRFRRVGLGSAPDSADLGAIERDPKGQVPRDRRYVATPCVAP